MMESNEINTEKAPFWGRHSLAIMITGSVVISCLLVWVSLYLYNTSGAAQLDLSRPGYVDVRDKTVDSTSDFQNYAITGQIDQASIDEFKNLYDDQANKIKMADAFKGDPLSFDSLGINSVVE